MMSHPQIGATATVWYAAKRAKREPFARLHGQAVRVIIPSKPRSIEHRYFNAGNGYHVKRKRAPRNHAVFTVSGEMVVVSAGNLRTVHADPDSTYADDSHKHQERKS